MIVNPQIRGAQGPLFNRAPAIAATIAFLAGAASLVAAATPGPLPEGFSLAAQALAELPNLVRAAAAVALMALSIGLLRRVRMAWGVSLVLAAHGAFAAFIGHDRIVEGAAHLALLGFLVAARQAFFRRSGLRAIRLGRVWLLGASLAVLVAAAGAALWAGHEQGFIDAEWWALVADPMLGRAGRPVALAAGLVALIGFVSLVATRATPALPAPDGSELQSVAAALARAETPRPEAILAFAGDKRFVFDPSGDAFIMYAATGGSLISMGGPVGKRAAWRPALDAFRAEAKRLALRPAVYAAPPELLPDLLDAGFRVEKIGENAVIDLADFSLSGRKREVVRRGRRKLAERRGATFELCAPPHPAKALERLKPVSDKWLALHGGREKAFSLGRFDPAFLDACSIGIVEIEGKPAAFGSLWTTPDKGWAGIDLMRYAPDDAPTNTMDFLLAELMLWAKAEGYAKFDLAMAPLSGLGEGETSPLFARLGRLIYERGERVYNFQGLRRFKQKFDPAWEPRYLAAPGAWSLPVVLAEAAMLTNGGPLKPKDEPEAEAS
ncbi:MAG: phosphatidylglycerol lysyltransferase domain-containing protein [Pseudomonadota bacterium]